MNAKRRCGLAAAMALAAFCAPATQVSAADDGGIGAFFRDALGMGADPQPAPAYEPPGYDSPADRPVVVRRKRTHTAVRRPEAKIAVGPVAPISIYEDRTLKRGDAVMTKKGLRVFVGDHGAPYSEADFATLSEADGLPKQVEKELVAINKAPHG